MEEPGIQMERAAEAQRTAIRPKRVYKKKEKAPVTKSEFLAGDTLPVPAALDRLEEGVQVLGEAICALIHRLGAVTGEMLQDTGYSSGSDKPQSIRARIEFQCDAIRYFNQTINAQIANLEI